MSICNFAHFSLINIIFRYIHDDFNWSRPSYKFYHNLFIFLLIEIKGIVNFIYFLTDTKVYCSEHVYIERVSVLFLKTCTQVEKLSHRVNAVSVFLHIYQIVPKGDFSNLHPC